MSDVQEPTRSTGSQLPRRTVLLSGLGLAVGASLAIAVPAYARSGGRTPHPTPDPTPAPGRLTLPAATGRYPVGTTSVHLVDTSRPDPWVPTVPFRELMIQFWYPAHDVQNHPRTPWLTPLAEKAWRNLQGLPDLPGVQFPLTDGHLDAPVRRQPFGWPVVAFSTGFRGDRALGTVLVQDLASRGYVVVAIDHTYEADVVEFPDGRVETSVVPDGGLVNGIDLAVKDVESRAADVRFVLDQLAVLHRGGNPDHEHKPLPAGLADALDLRHIGLLGQSIGGATAAHVQHLDRRIAAGANLDGTIWTQPALAGSDRPFLLFGEEVLDPDETRSWAQFTAAQRGPTVQLILAGSQHGTFTDLAVLLPQIAPLIGFPPDKVAHAVGTINGERAVSIQRTYLAAFFDRYLRGEPSRLLTGPSPRFPEITVTR